MKPATKFTFDTEFHPGGDIVSQAAHARRKKTLTMEELEALCADARAEGAAAGQVRASEALNRQVAALATALNAALDASHAQIDALRAEAAQIAVAAARKLVPAALAALPAGDVETALGEAMRQAIGEPRIVLTAAPAAIAAIESRLEAIAAREGYEGRVVAIADPALTDSDCRIEWRGGGAAQDSAATLSALEALIGRHFSPSQSPKG